MAAEAERVVDDDVHLHFARGVRHVVQIASGSGTQIDGGRDDAVFDGEGAGGHFHRARRAEHVAGRAFGGTDGHLFCLAAENGLDGLGFTDVALRRGSAVGVDVGNVPGIQAGLAQRHFHAAGRAFAVGGWRGEMVRVGGVAVADDFAINLRAALFGVFQFLQHDDARAFAHDEAVAFLVEGARGAFGIVVARAHGFHRAKAADADGHDGRFRAAGEHDLRVAHFDGAPGFADGVVGGGAGGAGGKIRPAQILVHREHAGGHVADEHRDNERREPAGAAFEQNFELLGGGGQTADAGADDDADFVAVFMVEVEAGIEQRLVPGENAELRITIRPPDFLGRRECRERIKIFHLTGDLGVERRGVKRATHQP